MAETSALWKNPLPLLWEVGSAPGKLQLCCKSCNSAQNQQIWTPAFDVRGNCLQVYLKCPASSYMAKAALIMCTGAGAGTVSCCLCLCVPMKAGEMGLHQQCNVPLNFSPPLPLKDWRGLFYFVSKASIRQLTCLDRSLKPKKYPGIKITASECSLFER